MSNLERARENARLTRIYILYIPRDIPHACLLFPHSLHHSTGQRVRTIHIKIRDQLLKRFFFSFFVSYYFFPTRNPSIHEKPEYFLPTRTQSLETWRRAGTRSPVLVHANKNPSVDNKEYLTAVHRISSTSPTKNAIEWILLSRILHKNYICVQRMLVNRTSRERAFFSSRRFSFIFFSAKCVGKLWDFLLFVCKPFSLPSSLRRSSACHARNIRAQQNEKQDSNGKSVRISGQVCWFFFFFYYYYCCVCANFGLHFSYFCSMFFLLLLLLLLLRSNRNDRMQKRKIRKTNRDDNRKRDPWEKKNWNWNIF